MKRPEWGRLAGGENLAANPPRRRAKPRPAAGEIIAGHKKRARTSDGERVFGLPEDLFLYDFGVLQH